MERDALLKSFLLVIVAAVRVDALLGQPTLIHTFTQCASTAERQPLRCMAGCVCRGRLGSTAELMARAVLHSVCETGKCQAAVCEPNEF